MKLDHPPFVFMAAVVALSCTDAPAAPEGAGRGAVRLNSEAVQAVETVLADVRYRVADAIEDADTRELFGLNLTRLKTSITAGHLDAAENAAFGARLTLARAATLDTDGTGDADRAAISLALDVANDEITKARQTAAGAK